ncbi:MAG: hypothetical protein IKB50_00565 [Clostridia bacterium]|nr:hypothetical protein [Clostridia bacterium]
MRKIILKILLIAVIIIMPLGVFASSVELGDYIQLGSYMGEPIVWRCVDVNENGSLMVADRIITLKSFDAAGAKTNDPKGFRAAGGSDNWSDSAIRLWLNSSAATVSYPNSHNPTDDNVLEAINGYSAEAGFLSNGNFTEMERNIIVPVNISSVISRHDTSLAASGNELHKYVAEVGATATNIANAYVITTTDKVFLLGIEEIEAIKSNEDVLGKEYFLAKPTSSAVTQSTYSYGNLSADKYYHYWLRDAVSFADGSEVRTMYHTSNDIRKANFNGYGVPTVNSNIAYNGGVGVRPAIYINSENVSVVSGDGTESSPYTVNNSPKVAISSDRKYALIGESVNVSTTATNIPDGAEIKYYFNGAEVDSLEGEFTLTKVTNTFEAVILDETAREIGRTKYMVYTVFIEEERKLRLFDFEGETPLAGLSVNGAGTDNEFAELTESPYGTALTLTSDAENQPSIVAHTIEGVKGDLVIEADICFNEINTSTASRSVFQIRPKNGSAQAEFIFPVEFTKEGDIRLYSSANPRTLDVNFEQGKWYHILLSVNSERKVYTVIFDGKVLCAEEELADKNFDRFSYLTISPGRVLGGISSVSFDNINIYVANDTPRVLLSGIPYGMMGDNVTVSGDSYRIDENSTISYYYNGVNFPDLDREFTLKYLSNNFTAVVKDKNAVETGRNELIVRHPYFYVDEVLAESDFESKENPIGDLRLSGSTTLEDLAFPTTKYGTSAKFTSLPDKQPFLTTSAMRGKSGDIVIDADICFNEFNTTVGSRSVFSLRTLNNGVTGDFISPVEFTADRDIRIPFCETPYTVDVNFEDGNWYHITLVINPERGDITAIFDGKVLCAKEKVATTVFDEIAYINIGPGRVRSGECELTIDNFNLYVADEPDFEYMFDDKGFKVVNKTGVVSDAVVYFVKNGEVQHITKVNFANGEKEKYVDEDLTSLDMGFMQIFIWNSNFRPLDRVTGIGR